MTGRERNTIKIRVDWGALVGFGASMLCLVLGWTGYLALYIYRLNVYQWLVGSPWRIALVGMIALGLMGWAVGRGRREEPEVEL